MPHFDDPEVRREYEAYLAEQAEADVRRLLPAEQQLKRTFDQMEAGLREIGVRMDDALTRKFAALRPEEIRSQPPAEREAFDRLMAEAVGSKGAETTMSYVPESELGTLSPAATPNEPGGKPGEAGKGLTPEQQQAATKEAGRALAGQGVSAGDSAGSSRFDAYSRQYRKEQEPDKGKDR